MKLEQTQALQALAEADPRKVRARAREVARAERVAQAVELRRAGLTYHSIGLALGCTEANAHRLVKRALRSAIKTPADALVQQELDELELMRKKTLAVLDAVHPLVSGGEVVHQIVRDGQGNPILDPRTNEPLRLPLHDSKPVLAAISLLREIAESRRKLLGVDAPKKVSVTDPEGAPIPITGMSEAQFQVALAEGLRRLRAKPADVVDATVVERPNGEGQ